MIPLGKFALLLNHLNLNYYHCSLFNHWLPSTSSPLHYQLKFSQNTGNQKVSCLLQIWIPCRTFHFVVQPKSILSRYPLQTSTQLGFIHCPPPSAYLCQNSSIFFVNIVYQPEDVQCLAQKLSHLFKDKMLESSTPLPKVGSASCQSNI